MKKRLLYPLSIIFFILNFGGCKSEAPSSTVSIEKDYMEIDLQGSYRINSIMLSPDGSRLAVWSGSIVEIYDTKNGEILSSVTSLSNNPYYNYMEFSYDPTMIMGISTNWNL